jgi:hypothetical protein
MTRRDTIAPTKFVAQGRCGVSRGTSNAKSVAGDLALICCIVVLSVATFADSSGVKPAAPVGAPRSVAIAARVWRSNPARLASLQRTPRPVSPHPVVALRRIDTTAAAAHRAPVTVTHPLAQPPAVTASPPSAAAGADSHRHESVTARRSAQAAEPPPSAPTVRALARNIISRACSCVTLSTNPRAATTSLPVRTP